MKKKKKIIVIAAILAVILAVGVSVGVYLYINRFDAGEYVQAVLDTSYKNETDQYVEITGISQEEAEKIFDDNLDATMAGFENSEMPENMQPKLDAQQEIYADIIATLDEAIANIEQAEAEGLASVPAAQDIALAGDLTQWKATAYGLKARYLLHQSAVNASVYAEAKAAAQAAIDLGFEGCSITAFNGINCDNPWSAFQWSREYLVSSNTVVNLMKKYDDPRLTYYTYGFGEAYNPGDEKIAQVMMVIDQNTGAPIYAFPQWIDLGSQPAHLLSKAEVYFILAETQLRTGEDATAAFQTAVASAVSEVCGWFNDPVDAAAYAASLGTPTLQTLFEQKYLAQCVDEQVETFNDMRRVEAMGESYITLTNPMNTQSGINRYPKRLPYGNSSVSANPNVSEAYGDGSYIYSEPVWWAGGTR